MNILGLVPARGGSRGVPRKNIRPIAGKSLIEWTFETARLSDAFSRTIISTDSEDIASDARRIGLDVPFLRPAPLAGHETPMIDVVLHALDALASDGYEPDAVFLLQPTSPFRTNRLIRESIELLQSDDVEAVCSVIEVPEEFNPFRMMYLKGRFLDYVADDGSRISRRQDAPICYKRDGNVFLTRTTVLRGKRDFYGDRCVPIVSKPAEYGNIDTPDQWSEAEARLVSAGG